MSWSVIAFGILAIFGPLFLVPLAVRLFRRQVRDLVGGPDVVVRTADTRSAATAAQAAPPADALADMGAVLSETLTGDITSVKQAHASWSATVARLKGTTAIPHAWLGSMRGIIDNLTSVATEQVKVTNGDLHLEPHYLAKQRRLHEDLTNAALSRDAGEFTRNLEELERLSSRWNHLISEWLTLRMTAAQGIIRAADAPTKKDDPERHAFSNTFTGANGESYAWYPPQSLLYAAQLKSLASWLAEELDHMLQDANLSSSSPIGMLAPSSTGVPLVTMLSLELGSFGWTVTVPSWTPDIQPVKPSEGGPSHWVIVDSDVRTGKHINGAVRTIQEAGAGVFAAVVVCENDYWPIERKFAALTDLIDKGRLIRLFTMSDLYDVLKDSVLAVGNPPVSG